MQNPHGITIGDSVKFRVGSGGLVTVRVTEIVDVTDTHTVINGGDVDWLLGHEDDTIEVTKA